MTLKDMPAKAQARLDRVKAPEGTLHGRVYNFVSGKDFSIKAAEDETEILLYDVIGLDWFGNGVDAKKFYNELKNVKTQTIRLKINSPGGDVFDGIAMYNDLKAHSARVIVEVTGLAASAASVVAMAADEILIGKNAHIMIHDAWTMAMGNKTDLREIADLLETIDQGLAETYAERTGGSVKAMSTLMSEETWMRGQEAVDAKFADGLIEAEDKKTGAQAAYDLSFYRNTPVGVKREIEAGLREAGYSLTEAKAAVSKGFQVLTPREAGQNNALRAQREAAGDAEMLRTVAEKTRALIEAIKTA